jgi:[acyl-carrier-protein] S-malonyltransferase
MGKCIDKMEQGVMKMNKTAFVFPGQGAQYTGMGKDLYETFPSSKRIFEQASDALGFDLTDLLFNEAKSSELNITENTQPAILTVSYAVMIHILGEIIKPDYTAGLSLGEYTAHVCAGSLPFEKAVGLVKKRGRYMQEAVPVGVGTMAAIIGLDRNSVVEVCEQSGVEAANFNCPGQIVISGATEAVNKACELCREKGAKRAIVLPVSAPFHSSLLSPAGENLKKELEGYTFEDMDIPVVSNVTALPVKDKDSIAELLIRQVTSPVLWWDSVLKMIDLGVDTFIEIGPGKTLTGFLKKIDPNVNGYSVSNIGELEELRRQTWN